MSNADDIFWRRFGMILVILTLFGFAVAFIARHIAADAHQIAMNSPRAIAERIAPAGEVRIGDPSKVVAAAPSASAAPAIAMAAVDSGPVDGEKVYNGNCMACHAAGVAGAPKLDDEAAWAPRIALGEDALLMSVTKGKGAMPPNAGNPKLSEAQLRAAIQYMTGTGGKSAASAAKETAKEVVATATETVKDAAAAVGTAVGQAAGAAGTAVSDAASAAKDAATSAATAVATTVAAAVPAAVTGKPGNEVYTTGCVACHATGAANAPKLNDKAAWELRAAMGMAALQSSVINGKGAMPPRGGLTTLSDADIENAIRYMLKEAGVEAGS